MRLFAGNHLFSVTVLTECIDTLFYSLMSGGNYLSWELVTWLLQPHGYYFYLLGQSQWEEQQISMNQKFMLIVFSFCVNHIPLVWLPYFYLGHSPSLTDSFSQDKTDSSLTSLISVCQIPAPGSYRARPVLSLIGLPLLRVWVTYIYFLLNFA
jgi:hypothetical protein